MQRLLQARPELRDRPVALAQPILRRGAVVRLSCLRARRAGVRPGMPVAEARAVAPALTLIDDDPLADRQALQQLAAWAERFSPVVGLEESPAPESLVLDITGGADCFHGEDRLVERVVREFRERGWAVRVAIADTLGAAWALCHWSRHAPREHQCPTERDGYILPAGASESALWPLPVAALRLPDDTLHVLSMLGFERIEQLLQMPRDALVGRVGTLVVQRLDQMLGRAPELIVPCKFRPEVQARCSFETATDRRAFLDHALDQLLQHVVTMLREEGRGIRHLESWFFHESAAPSRVDLRLFRPTQEFAHLRKLLQARLEPLQLPEAVSGICLRASVVEPLTERQYDLFDAEPPRESELAMLIDRLVSRLGRDAVTFATLVDDPQPEHACRFDPALSEGRGVRGEGRGVRGEGRGQRKRRDLEKSGILFDSTSTQYSVLSTQYSTKIPPSLIPHPLPLAPRPSPLAPHLLLARPSPLLLNAWTSDGAPARFLHGGREHEVARLWGPERIETGWWRGHDVRRDYYIVETDTGTRWWIFRQHDGQWFVQGWFD
mgnify:CR=1 FL=1